METCVFAHSAYAEIANHGLRDQPPTKRAVPTCPVGMMLPWQQDLCHRQTHTLQWHLRRLLSPWPANDRTHATSRVTRSQLTDWQLEGFKHEEKQSGRKIEWSKPIRINKLKGRRLLWIIPNRKHLDCLWNPLHCLYNPITGAISHGGRRVIQPNLIIILNSAITRGSFICVGFKRK